MSSSYQCFPAGFEDDSDWSISENIEKTCQNMKITIVPDITKNAGLNNQNFDAKLEPELKLWFENFKNIWGIYKKCPTISSTLQSFFATSSNPFLYSLKFFACSPDSDNPKKYSLANTIIEELNNFKKIQKPNLSQFVDDNLKMVAFNFMVKHGQQSLKLACSTFDLVDSKYLFINKIKEMISNHMYKESCQIAYELELYDEFTVYDMVFPLILQDKKTIAEDYLAKALNQRKAIVELLDSLLDKNSSVPQQCDYFIGKYNYQNVKLQVINVKFLTRFISRIAKQYNISKESTPNVYRMQNYGALQLLFYKKYVEKCLNIDSWTEMIKATVSTGSSDLQMVLIYGCCDHGDYSEAVKWVSYFNLSYHSLPLYLQDFMTEERNVPTTSNDEQNWDMDNEDNAKTIVLYHTLNLNNATLLVVDTKEKFHDMINYLKNQPLIALDSEWKPTFGSTTEVALIQLATITNIYLIDVVLLLLDQNDWIALGKYVFNNEEILKLGFSLSSDLTMLQNTIPALNLQTSQSSYLDLQDLWKKLYTIKEYKFPYFEDNLTLNLSNLVKLCFGKKLDKSNQFSNWENRPLRKEQITYAALDAYCLIEIYFIVEEKLKQINIDINELIFKFLMERKTTILIKKKNKAIRNHKTMTETDNNYSKKFDDRVITKNVKSIKFVCNTMLEGLGKELRKCGIDTVILSHSEHYDECAKIAQRDDRFILTRGNSYYRLCQFVPKHHCIEVISDNVDEQLIQVLTFFNVVVFEEDIFSRCQICNSGQFLQISKQEMLQMRTGNVSTKFVNSESNVSTMKNNSRSWELKPLTKTARTIKKTSKGAPIQYNSIPPSVINSVNIFYTCDECGKCYWNGSHLTNTLNGKMKEILQLNKV